MALDMNGTITIREAALADSEAITRLLGELGYELEQRAIEDKLARQGAGDRLFVADRGGEAIAMGGVHLMPIFHAVGMVARITIMIVSAQCRGQGIGQGLIERIEAFAREHGCLGMELTCLDHRHGAHRFYERLGYHSEGKRRYVKYLAQ